MKKNNLSSWNYNQENPRCPNCNLRLYKKHEGLVCKNHECFFYFKCGKGWNFIPPEHKNNLLFFAFEYDFNIELFHNKKEWLMLKSKKLYEVSHCEICKTERFLQIHHILSRNEHPELAMDYENLMVLCKECHKKIHEKDKYNFS